MKFSFSDLDIYGLPIVFNLNGRTSIQSRLGAVLTLATLATFLAYTYDRMDALLYHKEITTNIYIQDDYF